MKAPTGVEHASLYDQNNRQQQLGPSGSETFFVNKQGLKIATYFWPSDAPKDTKAVVLVVHGHGAHIQNEYLKRQVKQVVCLTSHVHSNFRIIAFESSLVRIGRDLVNPKFIRALGFKPSIEQAIRFVALTSRGWAFQRVHASCAAMSSLLTIMSVTSYNSEGHAAISLKIFLLAEAAVDTRMTQDLLSAGL